MNKAVDSGCIARAVTSDTDRIDGMLSEHDAHLCDLFGRGARLHFYDANWTEVCQRVSLSWETLRRPDELSWARARPLVQKAFEQAGAEPHDQASDGAEWSNTRGSRAPHSDN